MNYSLGHARLLNPSVDNRGYFRAIIYDKYDYEHWNKSSNISEKTRFYNNMANWMQEKGIITNYYVLIPVKVKI